MAETNPPGPPVPKVVRVAIAIVRRGSEVLICQRKSDAVLGGLWEFPGGKIEPSETPAAAARREVREELGIEVRAADALPDITHTYPHATVQLTPILCDYLAGDARPLGCATFRWIAIADLPNYAFPPANAPLIEHLLRRLV